MKKRDRTITIVFTSKQMKRINKAAHREGEMRGEYVAKRAIEASKYKAVRGFRT